MNKINYQKEFDKITEGLWRDNHFPKLLLHACCAPCSSYCLEYLREYFDITLFYYNPNITDHDEYVKRVSEAKRLVNEYNKQVDTGNFDGMHTLGRARKIDFLEGRYDSEAFLEAAKGLESCPEGAERCTKCFELRLMESARVASGGKSLEAFEEQSQGEAKFDYFTTTLTISPLKDAARLNEIGIQCGNKYGVNFLPSDFKKREGYKRSIELSHMFDLYRQDYCGCGFSKAERILEKEAKA